MYVSVIIILFPTLYTVTKHRIVGIFTCSDFLLTAFCYLCRKEPDVREQSILANFVLVATLAAI